MTQIHHRQLENGLHVLFEPAPAAASCAITLLTPAGASTEPPQRQGAASMLSEMMYRGAGDLDARAHSDALDRLGAQRSVSVQSRFLSVSGVFLADRLAEALPLLMDMAVRPALPAAGVEPTRALALSAIEGLDDEPQEKVMVELKRRHLGEPLGRSIYGMIEGVEAVTLEDIQQFHAARVRPGGSVLAIAGALEPEQAFDLAAKATEGWAGAADAGEPEAASVQGYAHLGADSQQVHIAAACPALPADHPENMTQRLATAVLSGGMSGRLFTEVREERGLCYSVYATYVAMQKTGALYAYAGTTPQRADQTLEVTLGELRRLSEGVDQNEYDRAVVGLKTRLVMQGESTRARASSMATDWVNRGRARTLDEIRAEIEAVTLERLNAFVVEHRAGPFTIVTIGPRELTPAEA